MQEIKLQHVYTNGFLKDLLTALLLIAGITLSVYGIYLGQYFFYRQQHPPIQKQPVTLQKITGITPNDVYDLSGSEASGGGDPFKLFDENTDPANGIMGDPKTHPSPLRAINIFYPAGKGFRVVVDLHDVYGLTDFYLYDRSFESDSVWVYTGDLHHWTAVAAYSTTSHTATWGWQHFTANQSARFVMIRFNSYKATISEMVLYGNRQQRGDAGMPSPLSPLAPPTLAAFTGTNTYDNIPLQLVRPFHQTRLYQMMEWYDTDTVNAYPNNSISLNYFKQAPDQLFRNYADSLHKMGNDCWMSVRGMPAYLVKKGMNEKDKPVDEPGMDTEDPMSYGRHARTFWTLAAVYGKTKVDTSRVNTRDLPKASGLGLLNRFENGNEEDAYWTKYYWTPMDYFAVSTADYDGHEGRLGPERGLNKADSNCKLMTSGMIQLDTNRVRTLSFLCRQLRKDKKFIWQGGVQYHYYSNDAVDNLNPPTKGLSPEADRLREKLAKVRDFHNRLLPGIPLILGENGYDRSRGSWQKTPLLPGYSEAQSQGIMCIRSLMAAFISGFDGYNHFMMRNATNEDDIPGVFATSGMIGGPASKTIYPGWYYWSALVKQLGDYLPDGVVTESGPVWIYRLKNRADPRKKAFFLVSPTTDGTIIKKFSFKPGIFTDQTFTKFSLQDNNASGLVETGKCSAGTVELAVRESPVVLIFP